METMTTDFFSLAPLSSKDGRGVHILYLIFIVSYGNILVT